MRNQNAKHNIKLEFAAIDKKLKSHCKTLWGKSTPPSQAENCLKLALKRATLNISNSL